MKRIVLFYLTVFSFTGIFAQSSLDYFPSTQGRVWYYNQSVLDSMNNPIDSLSFYIADSFAVTGTFYGKESKLVMSKYGSADLLPYSPYIDSSFINLEGSNAAEYLNFVDVLDTSLIPDSSIIEVFKELEGWYTNYKFGESIGADYDILTFNSSIKINGTDYPIRIDVSGKRNGTEDVETELGNISSEKFTIKLTFNVMVTISPFPPVAVPIFSIENYIWIAPDKWKVKSYVPSVNVDLSQISGPSFFIPGTELIMVQKPKPTGIVSNEIINLGYRLNQNYPNPFNPATMISFQIPRDGFVSLKVYDVLGREVADLIHERKEAGLYEIQFNADGLSSGVYVYRLQVNDKSGNSTKSFSEARKLMLLK